MKEITTLDFRDFKNSYKQALLFSIFDGLNDGAYFQIIDKENLNSLQTKLEQVSINHIKFEYLIEGPEEWKVLIQKKG